MHKSNSCHIYFVRHGESVANVDQVVGIYSSPLSPVGKKQARVLSKNLLHINFSEVYSSGFRRAKETAKMLASDRTMTFKVDRRLNEWNIGRLDGRSQKHLDERTKIYLTKNSSLGPHDKFKLRLYPEMETPGEVVERLTRFVKEKTLEHPGKNILSVTHGSSLGFFLVHLGFLKFEQLPDFGKIIPNTSFVSIISDGKDIQLSNVNLIPR